MRARQERLRLQLKEPVEIRPGEVPTRMCLERACLQVPCDKAMGPDDVPGEVVRHVAVTSAS